MKKILVIEDDNSISLGLKDNLESEGYYAITESDGLEGYKMVIKEKPDLILLDLNLPNKDGMSICKDLRTNNINTPIIMLTARTEEIDKVLGLELGADDYITKPFSVRELMARVKAILRRISKVENEIEEYSFAGIKVNFKKMEIIKGKKKIDMSLKEFEILLHFIKHEGEVISRNSLLDEVWGYDVYPTTRTVDNYILMLRKKIENDHSHPKHIFTIHTVGYKFAK
jgi:DNA-binding response OmpR family regulator